MYSKSYLNKKEAKRVFAGATHQYVVSKHGALLSKIWSEPSGKGFLVAQATTCKDAWANAATYAHSFIDDTPRYE